MKYETIKLLEKPESRTLNSKSHTVTIKINEMEVVVRRLLGAPISAMNKQNDVLVLLVCYSIRSAADGTRKKCHFS
jgi:hypothetical protein